MMGTGVAEPAIHPFLEPQKRVTDLTNVPVGMPTNPFDQRIHRGENLRGVYGAGGPTYAAEFHEPGGSPVVSFYDGYNVLTSDLPFNPSTYTGTQIDGNEILFRGYFAEGADLAYLAAFNGIKEEIRIESPEALRSVSSWGAELALTDANIVAYDSDGPIVGERTLSGSVRIGAGDYEPNIHLPAAMAVPADEATRGRIPIPYHLKPSGSSLAVYLELPASVWELPDSAYPLIIDPSIAPVDTTVTYDDETIVQEEDLVILSGGFLTLDTVDLRFDESYAVIVEDGGRLDLYDSYLGVVNDEDSWNATIHGEFHAFGTTFESLNSAGVEVIGGADATFTSCTFFNSVAGIVLRANPQSGHITGNFFDHVAMGIRIETNFQLNNYNIVNNHFTFGGFGLFVVTADVTGSNVMGNIFEHMETGLFVGGLGKISTSFSQFHYNYFGARFEGNANFGSTMATDSVTSNNIGVLCVSSTLTLNWLTMGNDNFDLYAAGCTLTTNGPTTTWIISAYQVSLTTIHTVHVQVLNTDGTGAAGVSVKFWDSAGVLDAIMTTNATGWANNLNVTEYELHSSGFYSFYTPHLLQVGSNPGVHVIVDQAKIITVYNTEDSDNDGRLNIVEDMGADVMWITGPGRAVNDATQIVNDYNTTSGKALIRDSSSPTSYGFITTLENPPLRPGTYYMVVRARSLVPGNTLGVGVWDESSTLLMDDEFDLEPEYRYFSTESFTISTYTKVRPQLTDVSQATIGSMLVDKFAFIREVAADENRTLAFPGHVTDPLATDTDYDTGADGIEVQPFTYWFEAEMITSEGDVVDSLEASNSRGLQHETGSDIAFSASISGYPLPASPVVDAFFRLKCLQGPTCDVDILMENNGTTETESYTIPVGWTWVNSTWFTPEVPEFPINITVTDESDSNLNDATDYLFVDRLTFADTSDYPTPAFFRTNPLDSDLDRDTLFDGHEVTEFFTKDKFQSESTPDSRGFVVKDDWLQTIESTSEPYGAYADRYFIRNFTVNSAGYWLIFSHAEFMKFCDQPPQGGVPTNLTRVFNFTVFPQGSPSQPIAQSFGSDTQEENGGKTNIGVYAYDDYSIVSQVAYVLGVGNYTVNVTLNLTYLAWLGTTMPQCDWGLRHDYLLTKKHVLNNFVVDVDGDEVTDGYEFLHGSYPLSTDSDADLVNDKEELFAGVDGRVTNPLSHDTDGDFVSDYVEIFVNPTNATNPDTDGDHLPDGWTDGFHYDLFYQIYVVDDWFRDGIRQPWEGEDLNANGAISTSAFSYNDGTGQSTGGETNPNDIDTDDDSMPDSWELQWRGITLSTGSPMMLNPIGTAGFNNASDDQDADGLTNFGEFNFDTDPYRVDTEVDGVKDGDEIRIAFRTDIKQGAVTTSFYNESIGEYGVRYAYADANPYDGTAGRVYGYSGMSTNPTLLTINHDGTFESSTNVHANDPLWSGSVNGVDNSYAVRVQKQNGVYPNGAWYFNISGNDTSTSNSYAYYKAYSVNIQVQPTTYLQWRSFVYEAPTIDGRISLELHFTDGNYIRDMGVRDEFGNYLHPALHNNSIGVWEYNSYNISVAQGKVIDYIAVVYDDYGLTDTVKGVFKAFIDDVRVVVMDETTRAAWSSNNANRLVATLRDGSNVFEGFNVAGVRALYVWSASSDLVDANDDGVIVGTFWRFVYTTSFPAGADSAQSVLGFRLKELHGTLDPLSNDSDRDAILDGWDGPRSGNSNNWAGDVDGDGWPNAADTDSDNDTLPDRYENFNGNITFDPELNETDAYNSDSDGDGIRDDIDAGPLDYDNDGLTGFSGHTMEEGNYGTLWNDEDTDHDGLTDGGEDENNNAAYDPGAGETWALDVDSDDDGLWDGSNRMWGGNFNYKVEAETQTLVGTNWETDSTASNGKSVPVGPGDSVTASFYITSVNRGLYQLNLTVSDEYNRSAAGDHNPKTISIEWLDPNGDKVYASASRIETNLSGTSKGNWTNLSLQWNIRMGIAGTYSVTISYPSNAPTGREWRLDSVNLSRIMYAGEISFGTSPVNSDSDMDHLKDGTEIGITAVDILSESVAEVLGYHGTGTTYSPDADNASATNPVDIDTDRDGLWDGWLDTAGLTSSNTDDVGEDYDADGMYDVPAPPTNYPRYESKPWANDTDEDGLTDGNERYLAGITDPGDWDSDNDGLPDGLELGVTECYDHPWETCHEDNDSATTTLPKVDDTDGDLLKDGTQEDNANYDGKHDPTLGESNPLDSDEDDDGIRDGYEWSEEGYTCLQWVANNTHTPNTNKCDTDSDDDGLRDGLEDFSDCVNWTIASSGQTGGCNPDSDLDGITDGDEVARGMNPLVTDSDYDTVLDMKEHLWDQDTDGDGSINALDTDSDNDGLSDGYEELVQDGVYNAASDRGNMTNADTDGDGFADKNDLDKYGGQIDYIRDADNDGLTGFSWMGYSFSGEEGSPCNTDPLAPDTDGDDRLDSEESCTSDADGDQITNVLDWDSDNDGLSDGAEIAGWYLFFANGATKFVTSEPLDADTDDDGLNDGEEAGDDFYGDPRALDTDGDNLCDKAQTNPVCYEDPDSTALDRDAPLIENVKLSVKSKSDGFWGGLADTFNMNTFWVKVSAFVWDPSQICTIVITLIDLAPAPVPDPTDDPESEQTDAQLQLAAQQVAKSVEENESVAREIPIETGVCQSSRFKYGTDNTYQRIVSPNPFSAWGGNVSAEFTINDRGVLKDGYRILVEAQDRSGNIQSVEKEGQLEANWLERAWDTINVWEDAAAAIVRAFLAWLVEATGPIMGLVLGLIISIAKNIVDMIFGLPQMIDMMVFHFKDTVSSFGQMFNNLGAVFEGMISSMIDEAEQMLPGAWKVYAKPTPSSLLNEIITFFSNPFGYPGTNNRVLYDLAYIVGSIIGFVIMNFLGGGAAVAGKLKSLTGVSKMTTKAKGIVAGTHAAGKATQITKKVTSVVKNGATKAKDGVLALAKKAIAGLEDASQAMMKSMKKVLSKLGSKVPHKKSTVKMKNSQHGDGFDGGAQIEHSTRHTKGAACALTSLGIQAAGSCGPPTKHYTQSPMNRKKVFDDVKADADFQALYKDKWESMTPNQRTGALSEGVANKHMKARGLEKFDGPHHTNSPGPDGWYVSRNAQGDIDGIFPLEVKGTRQDISTLPSGMNHGGGQLFDDAYLRQHAPPDILAAMDDGVPVSPQLYAVGDQPLFPSPEWADVELQNVPTMVSLDMGADFMDESMYDLYQSWASG